MNWDATPLAFCFVRALGLFLFCLGLHIPMTRLTGNSRLVFRSLTLGLWVGIFYFVTRFVFREKIIEVFIDLFIFICFWNSFLIFLINLLNSFSLRMVGEIYRSRDQRLSKEDLDLIFSDQESFNSRLDAMEKNGFLKWDKPSGTISLLSKGFIYGHFFFGLRKFLGIKSFG